MKKIARYLLDRLREPTSAVGYVLAIGTTTGWHLKPEIVTAWAAIAAGIVGLVLYLYPELRKGDDE